MNTVWNLHPIIRASILYQLWAEWTALYHTTRSYVHDSASWQLIIDKEEKNEAFYLDYQLASTLVESMNVPKHRVDYKDYSMCVSVSLNYTFLLVYSHCLSLGHSSLWCGKKHLYNITRTELASLAQSLQGLQ